MTEPKTKNPVRRLTLLIALMALAVGLLVVPADPAQRRASAAICCCACNAEYNACMEGCPPAGAPGHIRCSIQCNEEASYCTGICEYCHCLP